MSTSVPKTNMIVVKITQGRSQPHSPWWARVPLSSFFPQISIKFSYFSSNVTHFLPHFGPTREGPGYATEITTVGYMITE